RLPVRHLVWDPDRHAAVASGLPVGLQPATTITLRTAMSEPTHDDTHQPNEPIQPSRERDEATFKLLRFFFRELCKAEKLAANAAVHMLPEYLLQWIETHLFLYDKDEVLATAHAAPVGWDFLHEILGNA